MKTRKTFLTYCLLAITVVILSIVTTLALVTDEHLKESGLIRFDKVALYEHGNGSNLAITLSSDYVGDGEIVFNGSGENDFLWVKPHSDASDMFIRFKAYFSLDDEQKDLDNKETLNLLNNGGAVPQGFELYNEVNSEYNLVEHNGWIYMVTTEETEFVQNRILKVVQGTDDSYILSKFYRLNYDKEQEEAIFSVIENNDNEIMLKVEVEAIQCQGISDNIEDALNDTTQDVIIDSEAIGLESRYNNVTIGKFQQAATQNQQASSGDITVKFDLNLDNLIAVSGNANATINDTIESIKILKNQNFEMPSIGTVYNYNGSLYAPTSWLINSKNGEIAQNIISYNELVEFKNKKSEVTLYAKWDSKACLVLTSSETDDDGPFLGSTSRNSKLTRYNMNSVKFVGTMDEITPKITGKTEGSNYFVVNCGLKGSVKTDDIKAYWFPNSSSKYDVYVYQEGGVYLNPNSASLFRWVGRGTITTFDTTSWDIHTSHVTNMASMFYGCAYTSLKYFKLASNFDTSNVTNMSYMFRDFARGTDTFNTSNWLFELGENFKTSKVTNMSYMFQFALWYLPKFTLPEGFDTSNVTNMTGMFNQFGVRAMKTIDLSLANFNMKKVTNISEMFYNCGNSEPNTLLELNLGRFMYDKVDANGNTIGSLSYSNALEYSGPYTCKVTVASEGVRKWIKNRDVGTYRWHIDEVIISPLEMA